jgi:hypothetical protein
MPAVGDLASKIAGTDFVPEAMRGKPAVVAAAILYGRELGMEPMTALRSINVVKGKPSLSSEAMRALVLAAGHDIRIAEMTATRCVIEGRRRGQDEPTRVAYSMDDAKRAGLAGQAQYTKMPRQMLTARATAELCRLIFADVIGGLIAVEEAEADWDTDAPAPSMPSAKLQRKRASAAAAEAEPVIEDGTDFVDAELLEDLEPVIEDAPEPVIEDADTLEPEPPSGPALVRDAFNNAKNGDKQVTQEQMTKVMAQFNALGVRDRETRLTIARTLSGRESLETAKDLTISQASAVIEGLAIVQAANNPADLIEGLMA